jgi:dTDP-4-amino-4,6-dideoxygalactose transaminase
MIRLSKSVIGKDERRAVDNVLKKEYLGMGEEVKSFEDSLTSFFNSETVCVSSGTAAIQLAIQACEIGYNDEILVPSITYIATFQAIKATGAIPVPCDINEDNFFIDIKDLSKKITKKTKAIIPVHYAGNPGHLQELYELAKKNNLRVIEDAAHAFGSYYKDKLIGSIGDITCFSFDGIKNITSGEGGCVVSKDRIILEKVKNARLLGVEKDSEKRYHNSRSWDFKVNNQGWRYHMSNIMAAIGIEQLKKRDSLAKKRQKIAKSYDKLLKNNKEVVTFKNNYDKIVPHIYVVKIPNLIDREGLRKIFLDNGIQIGIHYKPNHLLNYFKNKEEVFLPVTESIFPKIISFPLHPDIKLKDVIYIIDVLNRSLKNYLK